MSRSVRAITPFTLALALASRAVPREGTFAASLAATMCDLKLLRIVAERMLPPPPRVCANRALACLVERVDAGRLARPFRLARDLGVDAH